MQQQRTIVSSYSTASKLLQQCLVKVCAETVQFSHQLQVMGIVCVTIDDEPIEIVVKINDLLQKASDGDDKISLSGSESDSLVENAGEMQASAAKKRRKRRRRTSGKQSCDSADQNSSDGATFDSVSNNENNSANVIASWRSANASQLQMQLHSMSAAASSNWKLASAPPKLPTSSASASANAAASSSAAALASAGAMAAMAAIAKSGRFECHACTYRFATARALKNHVQSSGHKAYKCVDCGALRKNWSGLELHCLRHVNVRRWSCMVCNDEFFSRPACIAHLESAHTTELSMAKQPGDLVHTKELDAAAIAYLERMKVANGFSVNQTPVDYSLPKRELAASTSAARPLPLAVSSKRTFEPPLARENSPLNAASTNRACNPLVFSLHSERGEAMKSDSETLLPAPSLMSVQSYD